MKPSVVREMTTQEIKEQIEEDRIGYDKMKMAHVISPLEDPSVLKKKRGDVARLKTELRQRQMNGDQ